MPVEKFHSQTARLLDPQNKSIEYYVDGFNVGYPGSLGLRVSPRGKKVWFVAYRLQGSKSKQKYNLAGWPAISMNQATKEATQILKTVASGVNPKQAKLDYLESPTFADLIEVYRIHHAPKKRTGRSDMLKLAHERVDSIRSMKAQDIRRKHIIYVLDTMPGTQSNRYQTLLRKVFSVAIRRDLLPETFNNPAMEIDRRVETPRDRVYSGQEIKALYTSFEALQPVVCTALKVLLLTGQRATEIYGLRWDEIEDGVVTLPSSRTKSKREHVFPLSKQVLALLPEQTESEFIFSARTKCDHVTMSGSRRLNKIRRISGVADFRPHDMRRTAATGMAELGVPELIVSRVLNHHVSGITAQVYNRFGYLDEKYHALQKWADKLDRITGKTASKVFELRAQA